MAKAFATHLLFSIIVLVSVAIPHSLLIAPTHAQQDPYTDYLKVLNEYFTDRRTFEASRTRYNSFKTLQSKETATQDAKKMLQSGRSALTQYTFFVGQVLSRSEGVDNRVKNEILTDLQTHNGYLQSVENTLSTNPTISDINTHSQALSTRYGYIKTTSNQALLYIDSVDLYDEIRKTKAFIDNIERVNRTLPDTSQEKTIAQYWIDSAREETLKDEEEILTLLNNIYPQPTSSQGLTPKRTFENGESIQVSSATIAQIKARNATRVTKSKETFDIMVEGYRKL